MDIKDTQQLVGSGEALVFYATNCLLNPVNLVLVFCSLYLNMFAY